MPAQEFQPGYEDQWWHALGVFRVLSVGYAAVLFALARSDYEHVPAGWLVLGTLGTWSILVMV